MKNLQPTSLKKHIPKKRAKMNKSTESPTQAQAQEISVKTYVDYDFTYPDENPVPFTKETAEEESAWFETFVEGILEDSTFNQKYKDVVSQLASNPEEPKYNWDCKKYSTTRSIRKENMNIYEIYQTKYMSFDISKTNRDHLQLSIVESFTDVESGQFLPRTIQMTQIVNVMVKQMFDNDTDWCEPTKLCSGNPKYGAFPDLPKQIYKY